jgi:hypothetical protein
MAFVLPPPSLVSHFLRIYKGQSKIERCSLIFLCQIWLLFFLLLFFYSFLKLIFFSILFFDIGLVRNYDSWFFYGLIMGHRFERLISLTLGFLGFFTLFFFFQLHLSTLCLLEIRLHDFLRFLFYRFIPVSWLKSWIWLVSLGSLRYCFWSFF